MAWLLTDQFISRSEGIRHFLTEYSDVAFDSPLQLHYKLSKATHELGKKLVIIVGSSVARESLDESQIQRAFDNDIQILNLGFFHARTVDLWMLSGEISRLKPDLIVIQLVPAELIIEYSYRLTMPYYFNFHFFELGNFREFFSHSNDIFYSVISSCSFIFRYRESISSAFRRYAKDALGSEAWHKRGDYRFANEVERLPSLDRKLSLFGQDFVPGKELIKTAMDKFLKRFSEAGVPVMIMPMPYHPKFFGELKRLELQELIDWEQIGFPKELQRWSGWPNLSVKVPSISLLDNACYADYLHLNSKGRLVFSQWFTGWLKAFKFP
jgi:hypothetical protein